MLLHRPGRFLAGYWTVTLALAVALLATQAASNAVAPSSRTMTLLTGQVVHLGADDAPLPAAGLVNVPMGPSPQTDLLAIPVGLEYGAHPYIDPYLFDTSYLERQGFGDDESRTVPVLVMFDTRADALAAARDGLVDSGIHVSYLFEYVPMVSGYVDKAGPFVGSNAAGFAGGDVSSRPAPNGVAYLDQSGVTGIYLDDKITLPSADAQPSDAIGPALDDAVKLIGADLAHQQGITGKGIKIAVVDTGIDASHPDLAGRVIAAKNFSADGDTLDHFGHGTHVASIAAGSGAASGGKYEGVAPQADLINAKALNRYGSGTTDGIIRAMEWAADQGASIINMSLGGGPSDGSDPMSSAVNAISTAKGALFVIAAGNSGPQSKVSLRPLPT